VGFFDSFKVGVGAIGDFLTDITGAALGAAPTIIPLLQSTGVIPRVQPSPIITQRGPGGSPLGRPAPTALPGGAMVPFPNQPRVNPFGQFNFPAAPVGAFPVGTPTGFPTAPSGVVNMPAFSSQRGGFQQAGLDLPFIDIVPQGGAGQLSRLSSPFVPTMAGARAQAFVAPNPVTGATTWFKPAGKPILWSGDLTACRRVGRIAARARRAKR